MIVETLIYIFFVTAFKCKEVFTAAISKNLQGLNLKIN